VAIATGADARIDGGRMAADPVRGTRSRRGNGDAERGTEQTEKKHIAQADSHRNLARGNLEKLLKPSFPRKRESILTLQNGKLDSRFRGNDGFGMRVGTIQRRTLTSADRQGMLRRDVPNCGNKLHLDRSNTANMHVEQ
jgi:hypothetical protein